MVNYAKRNGAVPLIVTMVLLAVIHRTSADLATLIRNSAQSSIERPERAALEPPTVTSLKPPERISGDDHNTGGDSVQSEHSGSHIPPVVASRSPSSSYPRNYKNRYMHVDTRFSHPLAPVATASSGFQGGHLGVSAGRRSPYGTQQRPLVPPPTPHLLNATTVPIYYPPDWNPPVPFIPRKVYGSAWYPPGDRSRTRNPAEYDETGVPKPSYTNGQEHGNDQYNGGGLWGEREEEQSGIWEQPKRHPDHSHGHRSIMGGRLRTDTFGHQISEDLSHLSGRHPSQRSKSRGSLPQEDEDIHIIHQSPSNPHSHLQSPGVRDEPPPLPRGRETNPSDRLWNPPATYGSHFNSGQMRTANVPPQNPITYGEVDRNHHHRSHGIPRNGGHRIPNTELISSSERDMHRPLSGYDILQTRNMSTFLNNPDLTASRPKENTDDHLKVMRERPTDYSDIPTLMTRAEMEDELRRHSGGSNRGGRKNNRRGKNKNKGRKNRNNRKKNKKDRQPIISTTLVTPHSDMTDYTAQDVSLVHNLGASPTPSVSSIIYEGPIGERVTDKPQSSTTSHLPTKSAEISQGLPMHTILPNQPVTEHHLEVTQNYESDKNTKFIQPTLHKTELKQPDSSSPPTTVPFTAHVPLMETTKHTLAPTATSRIIGSQGAILPAFLTTELSSSVKTTPLPGSVSPKAGSLTLPPSKPSEVSIIAFTVMKIPKQKPKEETVLEDVMPVKSGPNHHIPRKQHHNFPSHRMDNKPRLYPSVSPKKIEENMVIRTPYIREESKNNYTFPVRGFMIITGIMGALAVFTLVVLISYAIIKCSKQPVVNNYQVSEQKSTTQ
ncbi:uncharacterized protein [Palaemon carinicauda]|uniref:uncharacterized protein n=1 Tax=Palaemon carinicauda TaxID=392227 RepID=UPI0035B5B060